MKVLGIYREEKYLADKTILDEVLEHFEQSGAVVARVRAEDLKRAEGHFNFDIVLSMAKDQTILTFLETLEEKGVKVFNSAKSIKNCQRKKIGQILSEGGLSYPQFATLDLNQSVHILFSSDYGYWLKRADHHKDAETDILHLESATGLMEALSHFKNKGIAEVIIQENCEGEIFKFHGIRDHFFSLQYMGQATKDRHVFAPGNADIIFDRTLLALKAFAAARLLDLDFFGGDCIIHKNGDFTFIDFHDWPTYKTCRNEVAPKIVDYTLKKLKDSAETSTQLMT